MAGLRRPGVYGSVGAEGTRGSSTGRLPASFWGAGSPRLGAHWACLALVQMLVGRGSSPHCYLPPHGAQPECFLQRGKLRT